MNTTEALKALGLESGANQADIQRAYRELVRKWHPDFFQHDDDAVQQCNEKTKVINLAHEVLRDYKPDQGAGSNRSQSTSKQSASSSRQAEQGRHDDGQKKRSDNHNSHSRKGRYSEAKTGHQSQDKAEQNSFIKSNSFPLSLVFGICLVLAVIILGSSGRTKTNNRVGIKENVSNGIDFDPYGSTVRKNRSLRNNLKSTGKQIEEERLDKEIKSPTAASPKQNAENASEPVGSVVPANELNNKKKQLAEGFFFGSSKEEVTRYQGQPQSVIENLWFYGNDSATQSIITFKNNLVYEWDEGLGAILKISALKATGRPEDWPEKFTGSSSALHVAAVQGPPNKVSGNKWIYGYVPGEQSTVTFANGRVLNWKNNSRNPLSATVLTRTKAQSPSSSICADADRANYAIAAIQDHKRAEILYQLAADSGNPAACVQVALSYYNGAALTKACQWAQGDKWFQRASINAKSLAKKYDKDGMYAFGLLLRKGKPDNHNLNLPAAHEWLREAAVLGNVPSALELAFDLQDPENSDVINEEQMFLFQKASDSGSAEALVWLAFALLDKDAEKAESMLAKARDKNVANAFHQTAHALQMGQLPQKNSAFATEKAAFEMLSKALEMAPWVGRHTECLANCLIDGRGTSEDSELALQLLLEASEYNLYLEKIIADNIANGRGIKKNSETAGTWYRSYYDDSSQAALRGDFQSAYECGVLCEEGLGIKQDILKAIQWWKKASLSHGASIKRMAAEKLLKYRDKVSDT